MMIYKSENESEDGDEKVELSNNISSNLTSYSDNIEFIEWVIKYRESKNIYMKPQKLSISNRKKIHKNKDKYLPKIKRNSTVPIA